MNFFFIVGIIICFSSAIATLLLLWKSYKHKYSKKHLYKNIKNKIKHIAIIADGNRRWAKKNKLHIYEGHKVGFTQTAPKLIDYLCSIGINTITLWCCSTCNLNRDKNEVANFLKCFEKMIEKIIPIAQKNKIKIIHIGRKDRIPKTLLDNLIQANKITSNFKKHTLNLAIDYSGRNEIIRSIKSLAKKININEITEDLLSNELDTKNQSSPNPDLIIRSAGDKRLSGFMAWQTSYSELYFTKTMFPAFNEKTINDALSNFLRRERTFGK